VAVNPKVQITIPVADFLEPFLDRYRYIYGGTGEFALLSEVVKKTTDRSLLLLVAEKAMTRLEEIYGEEADRYAELSLTETFNPTGTMEHTVRGYGTRAENSRNRKKAYGVLGKLLEMVKKGKTGIGKVAQIVPGKL
jgi:hypothetical protein